MPVNQLAADPAVKRDRKIADEYLRYARSTPKPIVERMQHEGTTPEEFAAAMQAETERFRALAARLIQK